MRKALYVVLSIFLFVGLLVSCEEPTMNNGANGGNSSQNPDGGGGIEPHSVEAFFSSPEILAAYSMDEESGAVPVDASIRAIFDSGSGFSYSGPQLFCMEGVSESFTFNDSDLSGHSGSNCRLYDSNDIDGYRSKEVDIKNNSTLEVKHFKKVEESLSDEFGAPLELYASVEYEDEKVEHRIDYSLFEITWKLNGNVVADDDPSLLAIINDPGFGSFDVSYDEITEGSIKYCSVIDFGNAESNPTVVAHVVTAATITATTSTTVATATVTSGGHTLTVKGYRNIDTDGRGILRYPEEWVFLKIELDGVLYDLSDLSAITT